MNNGFQITQHTVSEHPQRNQIENIRTTLTNNAHYQEHRFLEVGQRVRVRGGALDGIEGILLECGGETSFVISVDLIQPSVAVRFEGYNVEII
jgi:hypothetical protein